MYIWWDIILDLWAFRSYTRMAHEEFSWEWLLAILVISTTFMAKSDPRADTNSIPSLLVDKFEIGLLKILTLSQIDRV